MRRPFRASTPLRARRSRLRPPFRVGERCPGPSAAVNSPGGEARARRQTSLPSSPRLRAEATSADAAAARSRLRRGSGLRARRNAPRAAARRCRRSGSAAKPARSRHGRSARRTAAAAAWRPPLRARNPGLSRPPRRRERQSERVLRGGRAAWSLGRRACRTRAGSSGRGPRPAACPRPFDWRTAVAYTPTHARPSSCLPRVFLVVRHRCTPCQAARLLRRARGHRQACVAVAACGGGGTGRPLPRAVFLPAEFRQPRARLVRRVRHG